MCERKKETEMNERKNITIQSSSSIVYILCGATSTFGSQAVVRQSSEQAAYNEA